MRRVTRLLAAGGLAVAGCRSPTPVASPLPPGSPPELVLPVGDAAPFSIDDVSLPAIEVLTASAESVAPRPVAVRPLTEDVCRREAAARAPLAALTPTGPARPCPGLRDYLIAADRNRAAGAALDEFYQIADLDGRAAIARASLPVLDELRAGVAKATARGVKVPFDADDLDRRRATLLSSLAQAESAADALDVSLKRRVGVSGREPGRLRPVGPFAAVSLTPPDRAALVQTALETRADLRLLRAAAIGLSADSLPGAKELLEPVPTDSPVQTVARRFFKKAGAAEAIDAELSAVRAQLLELIAQRERRAADDVRAAAVALEARAKAAAFARWRVDFEAKKLAEGPDAGPLAQLARELELARVRSELVAAAAAVQRARAALLAAQGLLGG